jgi:hypothetical protein
VTPVADRGLLSPDGAVQASLSERFPMSDKSPRQSMTKKAGKSIKEKRAEKRDQGSSETFTDKTNPTKKK